jgi:hypothetical protein
MFRLLLCTLLAMLAILANDARAADSRCFEMRVYFAAPGKLDELHARFRNHTCQLFEKHGITNIGYWVPIENTENKLVYVLAYPSKEARESAWKAFQADPEWVAAKAESEKNGKLVAKVVSTFLQATDFSPEVDPAKTGMAKVFELRTYTATPGHLDLLLKRFREHTLGLFTKHGMTNLWYWTLLPGQPNAESTLVYMLGHTSKEAAAASWAAFRADPDWVAAKAASEKEAGGSLTVEPNGVKSEFLVPTDYSPVGPPRHTAASK